MVDYEKAREMVERGSVEVAPLAFMRGRTLSKAFVILDEAQNTTRRQMKMLLTRLGGGSKCVVAGDATQTDLPRGERSGLHEAVNLLKDVEGVKIIQFSEEDVIRHPLVSRIVKAYRQSEESQD
jgi:phosphate starvation-inducible PhoH-like protein